LKEGLPRSQREKMDLRTRIMALVLFYLFVLFCPSQAANSMLPEGKLKNKIYNQLKKNIV
jgi:hypothetical protein